MENNEGTQFGNMVVALGVFLFALVSSAAGDIDVKVTVDWDTEIIRTKTAVNKHINMNVHLGTQHQPLARSARTGGTPVRLWGVEFDSKVPIF